MTFGILAAICIIIFGGLIVANCHYNKLLTIDDKFASIDLYIIHLCISLIGLAIASAGAGLLFVKLIQVTV